MLTMDNSKLSITVTTNSDIVCLSLSSVFGNCYLCDVKGIHITFLCLNLLSCKMEKIVVHINHVMRIEERIHIKSLEAFPEYSVLICYYIITLLTENVVIIFLY